MRAKIPRAFPLNQQYVSNMIAPPAAAAPQPPEPAGEPAAAAPEPSDPALHAGARRKGDPWNYNEVRMQFIRTKQSEDGLSFSAAKELWDRSESKRALLGKLSLPELKKRRFVRKECTSNPWCAAPSA